MRERNLSYEKRILDLLGYTYEEQGNDKWIILDDKGINVGSITAEEIDDDIKYTMTINSDTISYNDSRIYDNETYGFRTKNGSLIYIRLGQYCRFIPDEPIISIYNEKYGDINIHFYEKSYESGIINSIVNSLTADYTYNMGEYKVSESVHLRNKEYSENNLYKSFQYSVVSRKGEKEKIGYEKFGYTTIDEPNVLKTWERRFEDHNLDRVAELAKQNEEIRQTLSDKILSAIPFLQRFRKINLWNLEKDNFEHSSELNKTVEDLVIEQQRGIELFFIIRYLVKELLPFKEDILYDLLKDKIEEYGLQCLFEEPKEQVIKK